MSRETIEWLNNNTLIGFTEKRGRAWHYRQGNDNHYVGGVPVDDVRKRLFDWEAVEQPVVLGKRDGQFVVPGDTEVPGYKAWVHSKTGETLGVHKATRTLHQYDEWLVGLAEEILGDDLQIGTAGVLRGGRMAWLQAEAPETVETAEGVTFRPFILFRSAHDGSFATSASRSVTNTVCDNTMFIASTEHGGQKITFRASGSNEVKLTEAREALGILAKASEDFQAQVAELTSTEFTNRQFEALIELEFPGDRPTDINSSDFHRRLTHWKKLGRKREYMRDLWLHDARVAPWTGTAFGAWQAFNTYDQHERTIRGGNRVERNQLQLVRGQQDRADAQILGKILELAS